MGWPVKLDALHSTYVASVSLQWCHNESMMASQISGVFIVYSTVCSGADQRKQQSSVALAFVRGIHRWPVDSPHKGPVIGKMFPYEDIIMVLCCLGGWLPSADSASLLHDDAMTWAYFLHYWPSALVGIPLLTHGFSTQRASNAEL